MRYLSPFFSLLFILLLQSCYDNPTSPSDENSSPFLWLGNSPTPPPSPEINSAYFNTASQTSFIWSGTSWDTIAISGIDKISLVWLGTFSSPPDSAEIDNAYFNSNENTSYIFNGTTWDTLTSSGKDAFSLQWQGTHTTPPKDPKKMWAYYNNIDLTAYIYTGSNWEPIAATGMNGIDIVWKGNLETAPINPQKNWAYYNSVLKSSYLYNGDEWVLICRDGTKGKKGKSVIWMGTLPTPPPYPKEYWAYFNSTSFTSYIYLQDSWEILTASAQNGKSVVWKGTLTEPPENPQENWAYYNEIDKCSYIYTGQNWYILCKDGKSGTNGLSVIWKGTLNSHPENPVKNWAYYNYMHKKTYLYSGIEWVIICIDGTDGVIGEDGSDGSDGSDGISVITTVTENSLQPGSELVLNHNTNSNQISFIAQYTTDDNTVYNCGQKPYYWDDPYEVTTNKMLYPLLDSSQEFKLFQRLDGSTIHYFYENQQTYKGLKFIALDIEGSLGELQTVTASTVSQFQLFETTNGSLCFLYRDNDADSLLMLTEIKVDGTKTHHKISDKACFYSSGISLETGELFICFSQIRDTVSSYCFFDENDGISEIKDLHFQATPLYIHPKLALHENSIAMFYKGEIYWLDYSGILTKTTLLDIKQNNNPYTNFIIDSECNIYTILSEGYGIGKGFTRVFYLCKFSSSGSMIEKRYINTFISPTDLHFLPSGNIALNYLQTHKFSSQRTYHFQIFDTKTNICSQSTFNFGTKDAHLAIINENNIIMTYFDDINKDNIAFARLVKGTKEQTIDLVVVNKNSAKLINNSSFSLNATLSLFGIKEDN